MLTTFLILLPLVGALDASAVVGRAQSGLLRTYALAFAVSVSILALVFLVVR